MFDEPSSYLDIKQRLKAAEVIRSLLNPSCYVIAVEHDLSVLDYLSDYVCCLYGKPSMYGVVTMPYSVREGGNFAKFDLLLANHLGTRHQHFPRWVHPDRKPAFPRRIVIVQDDGDCRGVNSGQDTPL